MSYITPIWTSKVPQEVEYFRKDGTVFYLPLRQNLIRKAGREISNSVMDFFRRVNELDPYILLNTKNLKKFLIRDEVTNQTKEYQAIWKKKYSKAYSRLRRVDRVKKVQSFEVILHEKTQRNEIKQRYFLSISS